MIAAAAVLWQMMKTGGSEPREKEISFSELLNDAQAGTINSVNITANDVHGEFRAKDAPHFHTVIPANYPDFYKILQDKGVAVNIKEPSNNTWLTVLINVFPFVLLVALWMFMMRQMQSGGNKALSFGKSRARLLSTQQKKITFKDVAGVNEAKEELREIIDFLREPQKFQKLGGRIPKGVLLIGPRAPARPFWHVPSRAKPMCPFSRFPAQISSKCSSAWAPAGCATSSNRERRTLPASSSLMRSMPWDGIAVPASAAATTNASRRSISCWSRWTALKATRVSS